MQIHIHEQHISLTDIQKERITEKVKKLTNLAARLGDESTEIKIEVEYQDTRREDQSHICRLTFFPPQATIRAEAMSDTLDNAVDEAVSKLKAQIERYKEKVQRLGDHA